MQLRFPFLQPSPDEPGGVGPQAEETGPPRIHFVRMRRARRYVMRVRPDGDVRVTIPRGVSTGSYQMPRLGSRTSLSM